VAFVADHGIGHRAVLFVLQVVFGAPANGIFALSFLRHGAAAEQPGGAHVFAGGEFFDGADGDERVPDGVAEVVVELFLAGQDAVVGGEEAELRGVTGGIGFAGFGPGAGGVLGVAAIGFDLSFSVSVRPSTGLPNRLEEWFLKR
jgi:hypothetical protein